MPASVTCPSLFWHDGKTWTAADSRRYLGGLATADTGTPAAVSPRAGVMAGGLAASGGLQITAGPGMTVLAGAGYWVMPHPSAGQGAYISGLMAQATLAVAAADPSNPRIDIAVARISDLGTSSSSSDVEVITGTPAPSPSPPATPAACLLLAQVLVPAGSSSVTAGNITDKRVYTAPPGGILPIANAAAAPAAPPSQFFYNQATGLLCRGSGTAGQVLAVTLLAPGFLTAVNTSAGATGQTPGLTNPGTGLSPHWGIGYGEYGYFTTYTDGVTAQQIATSFTADGISDYEVAYKWQLAAPAGLLRGGHGVTGGLVTVQLLLDGAVADTVAQFVADSFQSPGQGGAASFFTSKFLGTTPSQGKHTAILAVVTTATREFVAAHYEYDSGALIGDMHDNAATLYGAPGGWAAGLVKENCYVAVIPVPGS